MLSLFPRILRHLKSCGISLQQVTCAPLSAVGSTVSASTDSNDPSNEASSPLLSRELLLPSKYQPPKQVWVENLDTVEEEKRGLVDLHPTVFACLPRVDIIHSCVRWQNLFRQVSYNQALNRAEMRGGGRKPWPQKGLGRARHGSVRSPLFKKGGLAHGPRAPKSYFYMLDFYTRIHGLTSTLSVKVAQDDLHVVDNLDIPTDDPKYLEELIEARHWGLSVLFVDDTDIMPRNITAATDSIKHMNLMPTYGLNVYSMLKHETLVLTVAAVNRIEERIMFHLNRNDAIKATSKFVLDSTSYSVS